MNTSNSSHGEAILHSLLMESRPVPELPPRFQQNVWSRIEKAEAQLGPAKGSWVDALAALLLKPRFAVAAACTLVLAGAVLGSLNGTSQAKLVAQERYVTAVTVPASP